MSHWKTVLSNQTMHSCTNYRICKQQKINQITTILHQSFFGKKSKSMWFANCDCGNHLESTRLHYVTFISSELYPAVLPAGAVELDLAQVVRSDGCPRHFEEVVRSDALPPQSFPLNKHGDKTFFRTKSHIL